MQPFRCRSFTLFRADAFRFGFCEERHMLYLDEALALSEEVFKTKYGVKKPSPNEGTVVFHCQHGGRGSRSIAKADNAGYKR